MTLARRWPAARRVVLVDLAVAEPSLHQLEGVANEQGVIDVVDFGVALHRSAVPAADGRFDLLPAGPFAGGGEPAVLESEAWLRILQEAAAARDTLLLYVPAESAGARALVARVGAVLVLADPAETKPTVEQLPRPYAVLAVLEPQSEANAAAGAIGAPAAGEPLRAGAETDPARGDAWERLIADLRGRQRAARLTRRPASGRRVTAVAAAAAEAAPSAVASVPAVTVGAGAGELAREIRLETAADDVALDLEEPPTPAPAPRPPARRRFAHPLGWTLGVVLLVSLVAGSLHFLAGRFGRTVEVTPPPDQVAGTPPETPAAAPIGTGEAMPYAVALEAHQDLATAFGRLDALATTQPDLPFYIAPLERTGVVRYHLMAGPVADSAAALALRDTLLARRVKTASTPTDIRHTPLALLIGDYSGRADAEQQMAELRRLDIPSYLVMGLAADSAPLYRVFVGGFAGPADADVARQLLRAAGVRDRLIPRTRSNTR